MRVRQSCCHEKFEWFAICYCFLTNCYRIGWTCFDNFLQKNRFQRRIQLVSNSFQKYPFTKLDGKLNSSHKCRFCGFNNIETLFVLSSQIFDEFICLILRVNHQRPSSGLVNNDTIFSRCVIFWKTWNIPCLDHDRNSKERSHCDVGLMFKVHFFQFLLPSFLHPWTILSCERACVCDHPCCNCTISWNWFRIFNKFLNIFGPSKLLIRESWNKFLCSLKFNFTHLYLLCKSLFFFDFLIEQIFKTFDFIVDFIKGIHFLFQKCSFFC